MDTPTPETYTLSLHDALPISDSATRASASSPGATRRTSGRARRWRRSLDALRSTAGCHGCRPPRSEEHTSELQSHSDLVCRLLLEKKNKDQICPVNVHSHNQL